MTSSVFIAAQLPSSILRTVLLRMFSTLSPLSGFNYRRSIHLTAAVGLLGHYSKNDDLYITDYVTDVDTLYKYAPALRKPIDKLSENFKSSGVDIKDFPVFLLYH